MPTSDIVPDSDLPPGAVNDAGGEVPESDLPADLKPPADAPKADDDGFASGVRGVARGLAEAAAYPLQMIYNVGRTAVKGFASDIGLSKDKPDFTDLLGNRESQGAIDKAIKKPSTGLGTAAEVITGIAAPSPGELARAAGLVKELPRLGSMSFRDLMQLKFAKQPLPASERIIKEGRELDFRYPPSEVEHSTVGKMIEGATGKARAEESFSIHNVNRAQEIVANEFHLPSDTDLGATWTGADGKETSIFDQLAQAPYEKYEALANLGKIRPGSEFSRAIDDSGMAGAAQREIDFPSTVPPSILAERAKYNRTEFTGRGALEAMKSLRREGKLNVLSRDNLTKALGATQLDIAQAFEDEFGRFADKVATLEAHFKKPYGEWMESEAKQFAGGPIPQVTSKVVSEFKEARKELAKIWTVEESMRAGKFSPTTLANKWEFGKAHLDGNLKKIAESASRHRKAFQDIQKKGEQGPFTVWDGWMIGIGLTSAAVEGAEGQNEYGLALPAFSALRPIARAGMLSRVGQKLITRRPTSNRPLRAAVLASQNLMTPDTPDLGDESTVQ